MVAVSVVSGLVWHISLPPDKFAQLFFELL